MRVAQLIFTGINKKDAEAVLTGTSQFQSKEFIIKSLKKKPPYIIKHSFEWGIRPKFIFPCYLLIYIYPFLRVKISKS